MLQNRYRLNPSQENYRRTHGDLVTRSGYLGKIVTNMIAIRANFRARARARARARTRTRTQIPEPVLLHSKLARVLTERNTRTGCFRLRARAPLHLARARARVAKPRQIKTSF